ncbi:ABC transporter permease [TM7 phylum sp. oral taxon 350]|nr:ABC transporter permease [TM7 phylum sp. oral taxon 350]
MSKKGKKNRKKMARERQRRRKWNTFLRMVNYGIRNITRNLWLTLAAVAIMVITLAVILSTVLVSVASSDTIKLISDKVGASIYIKADVSEKDRKEMQDKLSSLDNVKSVEFISAKQAKEDFAKRNSNNSERLKALYEATDRFPATFRIILEDIKDFKSLDNFVKTDETYKKNRSEQDPSFEDKSNSNTVEKIGRTINVVQKAGFALAIVSICLAILIVFNTIRMAIFNRRDEIEMMKLIGASRSFIRGPFIVEAIVYGMISALVSTIAVAIGTLSIRDKLSNYGIGMDRVSQLLTVYIGLVLLFMLLIGAVIGMISSFLATKKHLKI